MQGIALVGHARAGKDTVAQHLVRHHGFTRIALADPLKHALVVLNPLIPTADGTERLGNLVSERGWEGAKEANNEVRRLMQTMGTEVVREILGSDIWLRLALRAARPLMATGRPVVISDVRFPNEAVAFRRLGLLLVRIRRPGFALDSSHESETSCVDIDCDTELVNDCSISMLNNRIEVMLASHSRR